MDGVGNISISSSQTFPGICYVGREAGDALNMMMSGALLREEVVFTVYSQM